MCQDQFDIYIQLNFQLRKPNIAYAITKDMRIKPIVLNKIVIFNTSKIMNSGVISIFIRTIDNTYSGSVSTIQHILIIQI